MTGNHDCKYNSTKQTRWNGYCLHDKTKTSKGRALIECDYPCEYFEPKEDLDQEI